VYRRYAIACLVTASIVLGLVLSASFVVAHWIDGPRTPRSATTLVEIGPKTLTAPVYPATFTETGLPLGGSGGLVWSITVGTQTANSSSGTIKFHLANGSYPYQVNMVPGYKPSSPSGNVTILGGPWNVTVKFAVTKYSITFAEAGLPSGTPWCVQLKPGGATCSGVRTTKLNEPNGSYSFTATATGYLDQNGTVVVNGSSPDAIQVNFTAATTSHTSGIPTVDYEIIVGVVAVVAIGLLVVLLRRRKRRPSGSPESPSPDVNSVPPPPPSP